MKIINPLSPNGTKEDIKTVLRVLAGQGGCDGEPYDQMQAAADYIAELEATVEKMKCCGNCKNHTWNPFEGEEQCEKGNVRLAKEKCEKWEKR